MSSYVERSTLLNQSRETAAMLDAKAAAKQAATNAEGRKGKHWIGRKKPIKYNPHAMRRHDVIPCHVYERRMLYLTAALNKLREIQQRNRGSSLKQRIAYERAAQTAQRIARPMLKVVVGEACYWISRSVLADWRQNGIPVRILAMPVSAMHVSIKKEPYTVSDRIGLFIERASYGGHRGVAPGRMRVKSQPPEGFVKAGAVRVPEHDRKASAEP